MNSVLLLGLLMLLGLLSSRVAKKAKVPSVTGYLFIGLITAIIFIIIDYTSKINFNITSSLSTLNEVVAPIALGFIALSIGEEFRISKIKQYGKKIVIITILQALTATILVDIAVIIVCLILKLNLSIALCLGAIATATAPAATIMVINQYKAKGELVDLLLPVVAFDDAIGLIIFSINVSISKALLGGSISFISMGVLPLINILGSLVIGFILGFWMYVFIPNFNSKKNHALTFITMTLIGVGLTQLLNMIKIDGESLEISNLLVCMMIGATYTNITKKDKLDIAYRDFQLIDQWTPFLFMLFFVLSGSHLAISFKEVLETASTSMILPIVIIFLTYFIFRSLGKYFGSFIGCKITKQDKKTTFNLGITLLPQAGVAIGMANSISSNEAFKVNNIGNIIVTVVLCATLIYELIGPLLTKNALDRCGEIPNSDGLYPEEENKKKIENASN